MLFMLMFALTQNITNATLCVVLASMSTNVVELSFCVSVCIDNVRVNLYHYAVCNLKYLEKSGI